MRSTRSEYKIGKYASQALTLTVKNAPQRLDQNGNTPVMLKTYVSNDSPYLQQQIIFSMSLYTSTSLGNANLSVPSNPNLVFKQLTDKQTSFKKINGTHYQVLTKKYLAFPQKSGKLTIEPQTLSAMMDTGNSSHLIRIQSKPIHLNVQPITPNYDNNNWLPSSDVSIKTQLSKPKNTLKIGDTLIWTIKTNAKNVLPEQIPQPTFNSTKAYKLYPEPATFNSQKNNNNIISQQITKIEVVPTKGDHLKLPDVSVAYWDTQSNTEKTVAVSTPSIKIAPLSLNKDTRAKTEKTVQDGNAKNYVLTKKNTKVKQKSGLNNHQYIILELAILIIIVFLLWSILFLKKRNTENDETSILTLQKFTPLSNSNEKSAFKSLIECCRKNDISQLRSHLLAWAYHRWGDNEIRSVEDIKRLIKSVSLTELIMEAELILYSKHSDHQWQGSSLADALEAYKTEKPKESQLSQLRTLYPNF